MSFKQNDTVTLRNYEEYFILYLDNELDASQQAMVEAFAAQHPHLAEELDGLMSLKLPPDRIAFSGKEELLSPAMKLNGGDEGLLLYIDEELSPAEKNSVEERLASDAAYAQQHALLLQTKLTPGEKIPHPDKRELYRHERRTVPFGFWLRIAAAVILLLIGTWFFVSNKNGEQERVIVDTHQPARRAVNEIKEEPTIIKQVVPKTTLPTEATVLIKKPAAKLWQSSDKTPVQKAQGQKNDGEVSLNKNAIVNNRRDILPPHANPSGATLNIPSYVVNKPIAPSVVTSLPDSSYNRQNGPRNNPEVDWAVETKKKAPARGFFRKVSRFIERNTGIGTVSDDNELLVGAVALKLK